MGRRWAFSLSLCLWVQVYFSLQDTGSHKGVSLCALIPVSECQAPSLISVSHTHSATAVVEAEEKLQTPHGNKLVDLMLPDSEREAAKAACTKSMELSDRNACDVELLCVGCALPLLGQAPFPHICLYWRLFPWHVSLCDRGDPVGACVGAFLRSRAS